MLDVVTQVLYQLRTMTELLEGLRRQLPCPSDDVPHPFDMLSQQERRIALLIAEGRTNQQISTALGISLNTAKNHIKRILLKTGLASRTEVAVAMCRVPDQRAGEHSA